MKIRYIFVCWLAVCLIGYVGNVMYQRFTVMDNTVLYSDRVGGDFISKTEEENRTFRVVEVVCKGKEPFVVIPYVRFLFLEGEQEEDNSIVENLKIQLMDSEESHRTEHITQREQRTNFPEQFAKFSFVNGLWIARFYLLGSDDGAIGVVDTIPTRKTLQNDPKVLETLITFPVPLNNVDWRDTTSHRDTVRLSLYEFVAGSMGTVYGFENETPRITLFIGARSHNERE